MTGWLRGLVLFGALALSACIIRPGPGDGTNTGSTGGAPAIVMRNNTGAPICFVNISSTSSSDWGGDQLGSSETIGPNASRTWSVSAGSYDIRALDCNRTVVAERRGVAVNGATDFTVP